MLKNDVFLGDARVLQLLPAKLKTVGERQRQGLWLVTILERDFEAHVRLRGVASPGWRSRIFLENYYEYYARAHRGFLLFGESK